MPVTLGVVLGNRDFFTDALITEARRDLIQVFESLSVEPVWLTETDSKLGAVETWADAAKCGELFRTNRHRIDGILVSLPNFGDEKGVADTIRLSELNVPILVQACPDDLDQFGLARRRDGFGNRTIFLSNRCHRVFQYPGHHDLRGQR